MIRPDVLDMFFHVRCGISLDLASALVLMFLDGQLHNLVQNDVHLPVRTRQCLIQLAGLHGPIFESHGPHGELIPDIQAQKGYVSHFLRGLLNMVARYSAGL